MKIYQTLIKEEHMIPTVSKDPKELPSITSISKMLTTSSLHSLTIMSSMTIPSLVASLEERMETVRKMDQEEALEDLEVLEASGISVASENLCFKMTTSSVAKWATVEDSLVSQVAQQLEVEGCQEWLNQ